MGMELLDILTYMVAGIGTLAGILLIYLTKEIYNSNNNGFR